MNQYLIPYATLLVLFFSGVDSSHAEEREYVGDVASVSTIDTLDPAGPFNKIWEPYIAQWNSKQLLCCHGLHLHGKGDMGDIVCSVSRDGGKTWGARIPVFDHSVRNGSVQYAYNNSVLYRDPGSDIVWLFAMRVPLSYRNSENAQLVAAYTADGGYSWSHVEVANDYQGPLIIVGGIERVVRDGQVRYLFPAHVNSKAHDELGERRQMVLESASLLHWKRAAYIPIKDEDNIFLHEGSIAPLDDEGRLKIVCRSATYDRYAVMDPPVAWSSVSEDGGKTWSTAQPELELPNYRSKAFFGRAADKSHIYVYSNDAARTALYYKTRLSNGQWSEQKTFYDGANKNSYPTLIEEKPGEWLCVWDSSNDSKQARTAIRFGRLTPGKK